MATAADSQGIMALPTGGAPADTGAPAQPQLGLDDSYDAVQQGLQNASPDAHTAVNAELAQLAPQLDQLPDEVLDQLLQIVQYMHDNPKEYAQLLKDLVDEGIIDQGDFPEEYDPEFLATLGMVIMQARKTRQGAQQGAMPIQEAPVPPANMARGGIAEAAHMVASRGRGQDTMLAHITPQEARMLRSKGGMGTINPATGLPEYGFFKSITRAVSGAVKSVAGNIKDAVKSVTGAVKSIVSSPIGKIVATVALATFIGPAAFGLSGAAGVAAQMALASGAVTALGGGNMKDVLKSAAIGGATAFFGAPGGAVSNFVGGAVTNAAANAAITSGIVGTGIGLLSGQKLQDAVKSGITAGAISGLSTGARNKGFDAQIDAPKLETVADMAKNQAGQDVSGNAGTADLKPVMDPATGDVRTVVADNNQVYKVYTRPDGSAVYQPATGTGANAPAFMKGDVIRPDLSSSSASNTGTNANAGAFMKGDAPRVVVSSSAPTPAQGYQTPPTIGQSLKTMGGGISDIAQGTSLRALKALVKAQEICFFQKVLLPIKCKIPVLSQKQVPQGQITTQPIKKALRRWALPECFVHTAPWLVQALVLQVWEVHLRQSPQSLLNCKMTSTSVWRMKKPVWRQTPVTTFQKAWKDLALSTTNGAKLLVLNHLTRLPHRGPRKWPVITCPTPLPHT
jgi:hypothetical protein